jgi:hypothetical protein
MYLCFKLLIVGVFLSVKFKQKGEAGYEAGTCFVMQDVTEKYQS